MLSVGEGYKSPMWMAQVLFSSGDPAPRRFFPFNFVIELSYASEPSLFEVIPTPLLTTWPLAAFRSPSRVSSERRESGGSEGSSTPAFEAKLCAKVTLKNSLDVFIWCNCVPFLCKLRCRTCAVNTSASPRCSASSNMWVDQGTKAGVHVKEFFPRFIEVARH